MKSTVEVDSRIDGEFYGWDGSSLFKLINGQIWEQAQYAYRYFYRYRPAVQIVRNNVGDLVLLVDGISDSIRVRRVR